LLATNQKLAPAQNLTYVVRRWQLETTCEEARAHLGVETQRQWSDKVTARTTPAFFALPSMVTLMAAHLVGTIDLHLNWFTTSASDARIAGLLCKPTSLNLNNTMPVRTAAWYDKAHATFSDTIAVVRHYLWRQCHFSSSQTEADVVKIPRVLFERFTHVLCYAA
jgi:hypothetical protein